MEKSFFRWVYQKVRNKPSVPAKKSRLIINYFLWMVLAVITCSLIYEPNYTRLKNDESLLLQKLYELTEEKELALTLQKDLQQRINSQSDHDWIEMTLMRKLGLVAEGQTKVFFEPSLESS